MFIHRDVKRKKIKQKQGIARLSTIDWKGCRTNYLPIFIENISEEIQIGKAKRLYLSFIVRERSKESKTMRYIFLIVSMLAVLGGSMKISEQCLVKNGTEIMCRCVGNEEFLLPENFDYANITSIFVTSCLTVNLHFSSFSEASEINDIIVQNISGHLSFQAFVKSRKLNTFKLLRIRKISLISHDTFATLSSIENFHIEDTWIDNFEEQFTSINVINFLMKNVTIERMIGINFSERGKSLMIRDCVIKNIQTTLNFAFFSTIEIRDSQFELQKPGHVSIEGIVARVVNSVFTNVSMNLVASAEITMNGSCADGKSSLRLSAMRVESFGNRLPTEIVYTRNSAVRDNDTDFPLIVNNTVCIAGNCKCPKSAGHNSYERFHANIYLGILLLVLVPGLF